MARPVPFLVGAFAVIVLGSAVSAAVLQSGDETATPEVTTTTAVATTVPPVTTVPATTVAPTTTIRRATTTVARATTTARPTTTVAPATTTTIALTRAQATQALCRDIETAVRAVVGGNTIAGGLRLTRAVNDYGEVADPAVVAPARRMLSAALGGDLDSSAAATQEAAAACQRAGSPIILPGSVQCVRAPCP